jgi:signal transduction histidine kinase
MLYLPSLKQRLLWLTLGTAGVALLAAGLFLSTLFREHAGRQFQDRLQADLDQVMARLEVGRDGQPVLNETRLSDPRWTRPRSGLYWQVDGVGPDGKTGLLRSRSLWDELLQPPRDMPADGELHVHEVSMGDGGTVLLIERTVRLEGAGTPWRVMVAADLAPMAEASRQFNAVLGWSLLGLLVLLLGAAWLQVRLGLSPLSRLRQALMDLREGRTQRLEGRYPDEVQPLVDDLNGLLNRQAEGLQRARAQAGNLAHALKTPLTILANSAAQAQSASESLSDLAQVVNEQVQVARRHVDWHLARARAAAAQASPGVSTALAPVMDGLVRVMQKLHQGRGLQLSREVAPNVTCNVELQDLQEMLGNLLDNACKATHTAVWVSARAVDGGVKIEIDDDGPGIPQAQWSAALSRGGRLDEQTPGSGLGLAIVQDLAQLYGGALTLGESPHGGLCVTLTLPGAAR